MTQKPVDYSSTLIYKITCKDPTVMDLYVGHTTNFVQRRDQHRRYSVNDSSKLYQVIRNNGGWTNWHMEIIHFFNCKDLLEAKTKEQEYYIALKATLNSVEPMASKKEKVIKIKKEKVIKIKKEKVKTPTETTESSTFKNARFMCDKCNYNCNKESDFNKHLSTKKHKKIIEKLDTSIKHKCTCNKIFKTTSGLWKHKKNCKINEENMCETSKNNKDVVQLLKKDFNTVLFDMLKNNIEIQKQLLDILKN
jgi:hypothetical protein